MGVAVEPGWPWVKKSSVGFLVVATVMFTVAFAAPYWARTNLHEVDRDEYIGVWRYCTSPYGGGQRCDDFIDLGSYGDWLKAVQSFSTLAFIGLLGCVGVFGAYIFAELDDMRMLACALASSFLVVIFQVIAVGVFAGEYKEYFTTKDDRYGEDSCRLAWAWYVATVATLLTFVAPVLLLVDFIKNEMDEE